MQACFEATGWIREETVNLRCYARQCGDRWHAICTDLDIAADGASLQEAKASLVACVELYLEGAEALSDEDKRRWLSRKVPRYVRAQMALLSALHRLRAGGEAPLRFFLESDELTLAHV